MTTLSPLARAFLETAESAALDQKHRARIWAELQQRVAAESAEKTSYRWRPSRVHWGWFGCVASVALGAGILGAVHRQGTSISLLSTNACPPILASSCQACPTPPALEARAPQAPTAASQGGTKEGGPNEAPSAASQLASSNAPSTRSKSVTRANRPVVKATSVSRRSGSAELDRRRFAKALPLYGTFPVGNGRERQIRSDPGFVAANTSPYGGARAFDSTYGDAQPLGGAAYGDARPFRSAPYGDARPFGGAAYGGSRPLTGSTEWLEMAAPWSGAPSSVIESQFVSSRPLRLTPPQFSLTAAHIE